MGAISTILKGLGWGALIIGGCIVEGLLESQRADAETSSDASDPFEASRLEAERERDQEEEEARLGNLVGDLYAELHGIAEPPEYIHKYREQINDILREPTLEDRWARYEEVKGSLFGSSERG